MRDCLRRGALLVALLLFPLLAAPSPAEAREHRVRSGQSLSRIARRYRVRVHDLAAANGLRVTSELREGQVLRIPERGTHYVRAGESLSLIAQRRNVSVEALRRVNRLRRGATLQLGQRLLLPGHDALEERERAESRWGRPRRPGVVTLYRPALRERARMRLVDRSQRPRRAARRRLARLMRHRRTGRAHRPHPRLLRMLTQISDHFGGRTIHLMSGFRPAGGYTRESSRHTSGHAIDLRVQGVPNRVLRDYLRRAFDRVGVGYYPNSTFVHLDVRRESAYWVDVSGRGEAPRYVRDRAARERIDAGEADAPEESAEAESADAERAEAEDADGAETAEAADETADAPTAANDDDAAHEHAAARREADPAG
ncbi:MAG TPA: LysM peptidoglycan-binding domain-containing protein [Polyangiaceae bacterium LLY-WYZ-15_(1-7)]|nr:hypothetical protein [Myxococcales bacterium]MAT29138.1 hypothetical protein [Sandaracinus sp.]HJK91023.1 LysM peptidoglycan-binding domain-containing protein [Polyangiaceae bacterium LLY-WYZ-15_(1-7)]MBJ74878.1 hypothetical protein [Sandaracinus sp.]HJL03393.1 LysM peptidoglycan-binding domain-containing protein [Polyangiaceae bacterium LLY-WYZ-15_(1-7)]